MSAMLEPVEEVRRAQRQIARDVAACLPVVGEFCAARLRGRRRTSIDAFDHHRTALAGTDVGLVGARPRWGDRVLNSLRSPPPVAVSGISE